ncbi:hypothetical protein [Actinomadura livida]|uniref:Sulfotransferase family protein n=1 Tax=Actinomadura livida TaxID=79909 RepID=A0A7W7I9C8_9ACTN|nr:MULTISPECIES: hypothetical protein [Actinomadura]MBB4772828.1 hypothetical protein [Actinomadura catellatispora]GGU13009.1 hypothetical protein GCM10010208_42430 [Actinomadura livida]
MAPPTPGGAAPSARPAVFLHVGAAKSGTTFLQHVLWHNRHRLRERGVLYPGTDFASHVRAAFDLRRTFFPGASDPRIPGAWRALVDEARDFAGNVIISQELFAPARPAYVRQALADLDFADVHVVFTVRDLGRQIPAHWQEDVKNRFTSSFEEFVTALRRRDWRTFESARLFWGLQDPVAVLGRWGAGLPPERVHVVTLPRPGAPHDLLWRRFCAATGLVPDDYDLSRTFANQSLGLAETQFLLRINHALGERVGWHQYNEDVKLFLAQQVLAARTSATRIELPAEHVPWATERSIETVEALRAAGYDVVGDLYELMPLPPSGPAVGRAPAPPPDEPRWPEMADAGIDAIAALLERVRQREERAGSQPGARTPVGDRLDMLRQDSADLLDTTDRLAHDAAPLVRRAVQSASDRYPAARRLRGAYRRIQNRAERSDAETRTR